MSEVSNIELIVIRYCNIYMSHMSASDLEEIVENTLAYFNTGLHDTNKTNRMNVINRQPSYHVRAWVYTPDTHNDAGEWFCVYTFEKSEDAQKCIEMLKEIEAELKKIN